MTQRAKRVSISRKKLEKIGGILLTNNDDKKCTYYTILIKGRVKCVIKREKGPEGSVFVMTDDTAELLQCKRARVLVKDGNLKIECFSPDRTLD